MGVLMTAGNTVPFWRREIATKFAQPRKKHLTDAERAQLADEDKGKTTDKVFLIRNRTYSSFDKVLEYIKQKATQDNCSLTRMEFGPMYPTKDRGKDKGCQGQDMPHHVELRIDIDISDWHHSDENYGVECIVCDHFSNAPACAECWVTRLEPSRKVLAYILKEVFGVDFVLWVYSGKKGYHGIVLDEKYHQKIILIEARKFMFNQFINPSDLDVVEHIYTQILRPIFEEQYLSGKRVIPFHVLRQGLDEHKYIPSGYQEGIKYIEEIIFKGDSARIADHHRTIMRTLYWPRLDSPILVKDEHLLKIPFSVHDGTKRISIPIMDPETFSLSDVPTLQDTLSAPEILRPYVDYCDDLFTRAYAMNEEEDESIIIEDESHDLIRKKKKNKIEIE